MKRTPFLIASAGLLAVAVACSEKSSSPVSPSTTPTAVDTNVAADGSNLKVPPPTQTSPANGATLEVFDVPLKVDVVTAKFVNTTSFAYRFQVLQGGNVVRENRTSSTGWVVPSLDVNVEYGWRCRAEQGQYFGPWSATWTFKTPDVPQGYLRADEVYDPLNNGKTVGSPAGATSFIPNVGIKLENFTSLVEYRLAQTLTEGQFSMLVTNVPTNTEGEKTKIMSMREGTSDIITNDRRFTIEKRGDPPGTVAWRVITHNDQIDTVGAERVQRNFDPNKVYLWQATWGNNVFNLLIREGGANGKVIYNFGKRYNGEYDPHPHMAYLGAPVGRSGPASATVPGMVVRQVWLSRRPRPSFADK
jgi:hypothetical protein